LNVFEEVRSIASDLLGIPAGQISAASSPENIEVWDSVQHLNFVLAIEEKFGLQLSPEEMEQIKSIGEAAGLVESRLQKAQR
jgi:acyl carrier protein